MSITLFGEIHWDSPWVLTAFVALREKGLAFDEQALDLSQGQQRAGAFLGKSLTARVPTLDVDGFVLSESLAIVEYLEERFPAPDYPRLLPESREQRARARQILNWLRTDLFALRRERPTTSVFFEPLTGPLSRDAQADADKLIRVASHLLSGGRGTVFEAWSVVDADLALTLSRLVANGDPVPPALATYTAEQWKRPSLAAYKSHERT